MNITLTNHNGRYIDDTGIDWMPSSDALEEVTKLHARIADLEKQLDENIQPHIRQQYEDIQQARIAELEAKINDLEFGSIFAEQSQIEADAEIDRLEKRVAELESKYTALEADRDNWMDAAIIWHKYPDEKPKKEGWYLVYVNYSVEYKEWSKNWVEDGFNNVVVDPDYWAELPEPPREEK